MKFNVKAAHITRSSIGTTISEVEEAVREIATACGQPKTGINQNVPWSSFSTGLKEQPFWDRSITYQTDRGEISFGLKYCGDCRQAHKYELEVQKPVSGVIECDPDGMEAAIMTWFGSFDLGFGESPLIHAGVRDSSPQEAAEQLAEGARRAPFAMGNSVMLVQGARGALNWINLRAHFEVARIVGEDEKVTFDTTDQSVGVIFARSVWCDEEVLAFASAQGLPVTDRPYSHWPGGEDHCWYVPVRLGRELQTSSSSGVDPDDVVSGRNRISSIFLAEDGKVGDWVEGPYGPTVLLRTHEKGELVGSKKFERHSDCAVRHQAGFALFTHGKVVITKNEGVATPGEMAGRCLKNGKAWKGLLEKARISE